MNFETYEVDEDNSESRIKDVTSANGKKYQLQATDPYGFWVVSRVVGDKLVPLEGHYTNLSECYKIVEIDSNKKPVAVSKKEKE